MTYLPHVSQPKMADMVSPAEPKNISKRALEYRKSVKKIPEESRVNWDNFYTLPCSNEYSLIGTFTEFYDIMEVLYNHENLRNDVLRHIKHERKYYSMISSTYLAQKKLSFINWYVGITTVKVPADELQVFACGVFLNTHITVCHTSGLWTTLNIPNIMHNLAIGLSDIHLAYLGKCEFSLLCKNTQLHTKARKLFKRCTPSLKHITFEKELYVSLHRIDDIKTCPETTESIQHPDSEDTEIYEIEKPLSNQTKPSLRYLNISLEKELFISLHRLDDKNICQETSNTSHYPDSEDTEIYDLEEKLLGTITFINQNEKVNTLEKNNHHQKPKETKPCYYTSQGK